MAEGKTCHSHRSLETTIYSSLLVIDAIKLLLLVSYLPSVHDQYYNNQCSRLLYCCQHVLLSYIQCLTNQTTKLTPMR